MIKTVIEYSHTNPNKALEMKTIKTVLHSFYFNITKPEQAAAFKEIQAARKSSGVKVWTNNQNFPVSNPQAHKFSELMRSLDGFTLELETDFITDNQWNTAPIEGKSETGIRVFDYSLDIWPNKDIKSGYWLEQTEEMAILRRDTIKCGYCGKMEHISEGHTFHTDCIGSPYLEANKLYLLRLLPAGGAGKRSVLTSEENAVMLPLYTDAQLKGSGERSIAYAIKARADLLAERDKAITKANVKYNGMIALLDLGLGIENVIYYDHTGKFSFGWCKPVSSEVASAIMDVMCEFKYDYEIKCADGRLITG